MSLFSDRATVLRVDKAVRKHLLVTVFNGHEWSQEYEDCVQEAWIKLLKAQDRYDPAVADVTTWCQNIAENAAKTYLKRGNRSEEAELPISTKDYRSAEDTILEDATLELRLKMVERLPSRAKQVFELAAVKGWSVTEIALHLGLTWQAVSKTLAFAKRKLREAHEASEVAL